MECTSKCLDNGFLDRPEQCGCYFQIFANQPQGMEKLFRMEDPVNGVATLKFLVPCRVDADFRFISRESGPDFSSTLAEGDGRTPIFSHQETGPAKQAPYHLNRESISVGVLIALPQRTFHSHKMIPQGGDEAVLGFFSVRPMSLGGFGGTWPTW
jgi:hypothetical protein